MAINACKASAGKESWLQTMNVIGSIPFRDEFPQELR